VRGPKGREARITRKQRGAFDVGRKETLPVSAGDKLLIRGREDDAGFANGDFKEVAHVDSVTNKIVLTDGHVLPPDFAAWTYGHALTSYRSQGSTSEESLMVLGDVATRSLARRQFYVGNTRYRGAHTIYVSNKEDILRRLAKPDAGRELSTEFMQRHRIVEREHLVPRPVRGLRARMRAAWLGAMEKLRGTQAVRGERMET